LAVGELRGSLPYVQQLGRRIRGRLAFSVDRGTPKLVAPTVINGRTTV